MSILTTSPTLTNIGTFNVYPFSNVAGFPDVVAVFPANVYMEQKNIPLNGKQLPTWALWGRLPLQYVLIKIVRKM